MSRHAKLYDRLRSLEHELTRRVRAEMQRVVRGEHSEILALCGIPARNARGADRDVNEFFRLEHETVRLREKLGEPLDAGIHEILKDMREPGLTGLFDGRRMNRFRENLPRVEALLSELSGGSVASP